MQRRAALRRSPRAATDLLVDDEVPKAAGAGVGIRTFVIGAPGSESARTVLSKLAQNGGTAPPGCDPEQGNCHFDMTTKERPRRRARRGALGHLRPRAHAARCRCPPFKTGEVDLDQVNVIYSPSSRIDPRIVPQDARFACDARARTAGSTSRGRRRSASAARSARPSAKTAARASMSCSAAKCRARSERELARGSGPRGTTLR